MKNFLYYTLVVIIWGTTWMAIKFQLGRVDPMVSVGYRFLLAAAVLLLYCKLKGLRMRFGYTVHCLMALEGLLLFSVNYWLFYLCELYIASGLAAVTFATIVFMNVINGALFLKAPVDARMIGGALLGLTGICLVFWPELSSFELSDAALYGLLLGLGATFSASFGNILSAYNQKRHIPVIQTNAYGMLYGALVMVALAAVTGRDFSFEFSWSYGGSLLYLAVFGSVVAFGCYLTLIGRIGADRASYASMLFPLVALGLSTLFEGYRWTGFALAGMGLILVGNILILNRKKAFKAPAKLTARLAQTD